MKEKSPKVLITDDVHPLLIEGLQQRGYDVEFRPDISYKETQAVIKEYNGLIINSKILCDDQFFEKASKLKWVARLGSGMEIIDMDAAEVRGISVFNTPEGNRNAVAEHAIGLLLCLYRNLLQTNQEMSNGVWLREANRGEEIAGKTIGIIGFGNTGSRFASLLSAFGAKILIFDPYKQRIDIPVRFEYVMKMQAIQQEADVISLHVPLNNETKHMVDAAFIAGCERKPVLINSSRGAVVDTNALLDGLKNGFLSGACLDVFENEKPETFSASENENFKQLCDLKQVVTSPHIAGWTHQSKQKLAEWVLKKLDTLN